VVLVVALVMAVRGLFFATSADVASGGARRTVAVHYHVTGTGAIDTVTYTGGNLIIAQDSAPTVPWDRDVTVSGVFTVVELDAMNGAGGGSITCRILENGSVIAEKTANGSGAAANCAGDLNGADK